MHVLIVQAHPEPGSFNGALTRVATERLGALGHDVEISDLYRDGFDPVERAAHYADRADADLFAPLAEQRRAGERGTLPREVVREIHRLERADLVILQFPLWWHGPPAILKGWFDRVMVSGCLYSSRMRYDSGYFRGKRALVSLTTGAPEASFDPGGRGGDIELLLWPVHYSLHYMGFEVLQPFLSFGVAGHGYQYVPDGEQAAQLRDRLADWEVRLARLSTEMPLEFHGWSDWDEAGRLRSGKPVETSAFRFRTDTTTSARSRGTG